MERWLVSGFCGGWREKKIGSALGAVAVEDVARERFSLVFDLVDAAIARDLVAVFGWNGENLQEYWWYAARALDWGSNGGPDLIVDDGGDATLLIHKGVKAEEVYEKTGVLPFPASTDNAKFQLLVNQFDSGGTIKFILQNKRNPYILVASLGHQNPPLTMMGLESCIDDPEKKSIVHFR
ncbi:unnamed protein product [Dovyalis caffra]|uniref:Apyrase n=1 Tax=Dovyalis caffra TaxID=77055 RepID=A0AAV1S670_9ROSI|nr:unnamed protein product [Dovyalis caffra]